MKEFLTLQRHMKDITLRVIVGILDIALLFFLVFSADKTIGRICFYISALITAYLLICDKTLRSWMTHPAVFSGLLLITYSGLTVLWGSGHNAANYVLQSLGLALFWLSIVVSCQVPNRYLLRFANALLAVVAVAAAYTIVRYYVTGGLGTRNHGPNLLWEPNLGPSILIACGVTGVMLRHHLRQSSRIILFGLLLVLVIYILTTRSRTAILGIAIWVLTLVLLDRAHMRRNLYILGTMATASAIFYLIDPGYTKHLVARGTSYRLLIWQHTLPVLREHLWFGHGINFLFSNAPVQEFFRPAIGTIIAHPHNLFLSTMLYSGLVGFSLLILTTVLAVATILKTDHLATYYAFSVPVTIYALTFTTGNELIASPSEIWFIFWLPSACLSGVALRVTQPALFSQTVPCVGP